MKRIKELLIRNFTVGRPLNGGQAKILYGVFHTTADSPSSTIFTISGWWNNPQAKSSAHLIIGWNGDSLQTVDFLNTAWHAANWPVNLQSIGMEHQDHGNSQDSIRTDELYESSAQWVSDLYKMFGLPIKLVEVDDKHMPLEPGWVQHRKVSTQGTNCPGGLDCERIIKRALEISQEPGPEAVV